MKQLLDTIFFGSIKTLSTAARDQRGASVLEYAALVVIAVALIATAATAATWATGRFGAI